MIEINKDNFEEKIQSETIAVVDFWSPSCVPCKELMPKMEELSSRYEHISFYSLDVSKARRLAIAQKIRSIPCVVFYRDGEQVKSFTGHDATIDAIEAALNEYI